MPVKRRRPKVRITGYPDWQVQFMETGTPPQHSEEINEFDVLTWTCHRVEKSDPVRDAWLKVGEKILSAWIQRHPGTRPFAWWEYSSPRISIGTYPGCHWDGKLSAPRKRLNDIGTPAHEQLAFMPSYKFGIPDNWVIPCYVRWYPHKNLQVIDPSDPPIFESQAAYLDRYKLLTEEEREYLPADAFVAVSYQDTN